uniref:CCHC-type domain-containing protein n=1 Tax=Fagus sylvatica TaxID=28930 RepID=A0A2N9J763_FAGSY
MEEDGGDVSDEEEDDEPPEDGEVVIKVSLFESKEGFEDVLKGGPWFIGEHFLSHRPWVPNFRASEASISSVAVWVRLPKLPVEYYHNDSLLWIGSGLGPVLRVDFNTAAGTRGRFERLCIQLDIDKPLARTVRVGKTRLVVIYEGVGLLCFHCGKIGHRWEWCPNLAPEETEKSPVNDQSRSGMEEDNKLKGFGPWMLVTRRKRQTKPAGGSELNSDTPSCNTRSGDHGIGGTGIDMPSAQRRDSHANRFKYSHLEKGKKAQSNGLRDNVNIGPAGFKSLSNNDPLHVWGWYDAGITQAWAKIAPAIQDKGCFVLPLPTYMIWLQEISPFWNFHTDVPRIDGIHCPLRVRCQPSPKRMLVQFLKEVYCATLPKFEKRKVLLSTPILLNWAGNQKALKLVQPAKCIPHFKMLIQCSKMRGTGLSNVPICNGSNPEQAEKLAKSFPFDGFLCTNTIKFAGVKVRGSNSLWLLSTIYASPHRSECRILWENLNIVAGGNSPSNSRMAEFRNCINACNMIDLGFSGPKFTWSNCHDINSLIMEWLDRAFANPNWRILFPEASVSHLTQTHSDHCPLLLTLCPIIPRSLPRPFRFENIWLSHSDFPKIVEQTWAVPATNLSVTFDTFATLVSNWSKLVFGNIFHRKNRILARLNGAQCALAANPSKSLFRIEKDLREDYFHILKIEEDFWSLKSRVGLVVEGDRNTKLFHTSTLAPRVSKFEALAISAHVSAKDVKSSLWSFKPFKALGPNGLHPGFFQKCWNTIGDSITNEVKQIFTSGRMPAYLNKTLISLIPKCLGPETLTLFRPISLCNTIYKIVTKIIVCKIRPIIGNLVSSYQAAFVLGMRGIDNMIIAQEIIHSMHRKKGRVGQLVLKLDLEKAYDRLEWSFIREVLNFFKFPSSFMNLVLECPMGIALRTLILLWRKFKLSLLAWKGKLLSSAGRVVLVQSITSAIHAYYMQNVALPSKICTKLDKINRDFLWGSTVEKKKMHMVSWDKVCRPRNLGGLGLYATKSRNIALLAKLNWRVMEESDSLWAKTLVSKYYPNGIMDEKLVTRRSGSNNWKGLKIGHEVFRRGIWWVVNNGPDVSFWHDLWVGDRTLRSLVHGPLSPLEDSFRVCDVMESVSMWDFSKISLDILPTTREAIKAISVCSTRLIADRHV